MEAFFRQGNVVWRSISEEWCFYVESDAQRDALLAAPLLEQTYRSTSIKQKS